VGNFVIHPENVPADAFGDCKPSEGQQEVIEVNPARGWASINIISATLISSPLISIDEHEMWVYAVDGRYIDPVPVDVVPAPNGNRFSVLVKLDKPPKDYTIRVANSGLNQIIGGFATLRYTHTNKHSDKTPSKPFINYAGANLTADVRFLDDIKVVSFPPSKPAQIADTTYFFNVGFFNSLFRWTLGGKQDLNISLEDTEPVLFNPHNALAQNQNLSFPTKNGTWVDLVLQMQGPQPPHPIHKHSNKAYLLGRGPGIFSYSSVAEAVQHVPQFFNLENPPLRDGFTTLPSGVDPTWLAIRYQVVNPGAFLLHCHIQTHFQGGMGIILLDGVDNFPKVPPEYLNGNGQI
jgi:FtsP/CotA-like multicopper oxidase with cupredoxin domain